MPFTAKTISGKTIIRTNTVRHSVDAKTIAAPAQKKRSVIHQRLGGAEGQATDVLIHAEHMRFIKQRMNEELAKNTGKPVKTVEKDTERDNFMTAEQALKYGIIDEIIAPRR